MLVYWYFEDWTELLKINETDVAHQESDTSLF